MSIADDIHRAAKILEATLPLSEGDLAARLLAAIPAIEAMEKDAARLDFMETMARRSFTGVSFDYAKRYEDERGGYRMMWHRKINPRFDNVRAALDAAIAAQTEPKP